MEILTAVLFSTGISLIISAFTMNYIFKQVIKRFKLEDEFDEFIAKKIEQILDIIKINGLVRPKE